MDAPEKEIVKIFSLGPVEITVPIVAGLVLGMTGPGYRSLGWFSLIPWGAVGLIIGYRVKTMAESVLTGILYGFTLCFAFMIAGYTGSASLASRLPFFALIGAFGAVCGLALALAGFAAKKQLRKLG